MSAEVVTIVGIGVALAGLVISEQRAHRDEMRKEMSTLREEMKEQISELREKIDDNNIV